MVLALEDELSNIPENEEVASTYVLPPKVFLFVEENEGEVRVKLRQFDRDRSPDMNAFINGEATTTSIVGCPFYGYNDNDGNRVEGCALLRDPFCYLQRGSDQHPQVSRPEHCMPFTGARILIEKGERYPEPQHWHRRHGSNNSGRNRADVMRRHNERMRLARRGQSLPQEAYR